MKSRVKTGIALLGKLALTAVILWLVVRNIDFASVRTRFEESEPPLLVAALALALLQVVLLGFRWMLVMEAVGAPITLGRAVRIMFVCTWFNQVLPSSLGADAVRVLLLRRGGIAWAPAVHGVFADRVIALLAFIFLIVVMFPFLLMRVDNLPAIMTIGSLAALGVVGTLMLVTLNKWPDWLTAWRPVSELAKAGDIMRFLCLRYRRRTALLGMTLVIHLFTVLICLVLAKAVHAGLSPIDALIFVPPIVLLSALPISISGWGVREGAMVAGLSLVGVAPAAALTMSILLGLISLLIGIIGGIVWLASGDRKALATANAEEFTSEPSAAAQRVPALGSSRSDQAQ